MKRLRRNIGSDYLISPNLLDGVKPLAFDGSKVVRAKALSAELLTALFEEKLCAIHVPGYFPTDVATTAASFLRKRARVTQWYVPQNKDETLKSDMAYGIGHPLYSELRESYFANAVPWMQKIRSAFLPHMSPMDRLRVELDELWGPGALIPRNRKGQSHFAGLLRIMKPHTLLEGRAKTEGSIHVDDPDRTATTKVFSANSYVSIPPEGGVLKIWPVAIDRKARYGVAYRFIARYAFFDGAQEAIARIMPAPLVIRQRPGDLVLFDSARPHAVSGLARGDRMNIQTFLWYAGRNQPLKIYS